jgi:hypothetical protein
MLTMMLRWEDGDNDSRNMHACEEETSASDNNNKKAPSTSPDVKIRLQGFDAMHLSPQTATIATQRKHNGAGSTHGYGERVSRVSSSRARSLSLSLPLAVLRLS